MKLTFYGAAKEVTGSCYMVTVNGKNIIIDCGMQQGHDKKRNQQLPFESGKVDCVIVTHAHIDHSGRLPLLVKNGYAGSIHATGKTCELMNIMLLDSAHIQQADAQWETRKGRRSSQNPVEPLYTEEDVNETVKRFVPHQYGETIKLYDGVEIRFSDAGHLLGSAGIEMWLSENGVSRKIVFSGDIGNNNQPIIRDPQYFTEADFVLTESTYGDRSHDPSKDYTYDIAKIIDETFERGGNVVFPAFAVGRTQELLYFIREIKERKLTHVKPEFDVYVDSPLAVEATSIYDSDLSGYADKETIDLLRSGRDPIEFPGLKFCVTQEESKQLNENTGPKVIISASGMCDAGRIRHHLKYNLWRRECSVVFVGFQVEGTLGRILIDGIKRVKLLGEEIAVQAQIYNFKGLSAHADRDGLLKWIKAFTKKPEHIFVVHGEEKTAEQYAKDLSDMGFSAHAPNWQEIYNLASCDILASGITKDNIDYAKGSAVFAGLMAAGNRLNEVIMHNRYGANKDITKFTDQILELAKKWDRE